MLRLAAATVALAFVVLATPAQADPEPPFSCSMPSPCVGCLPGSGYLVYCGVYVCEAGLEVARFWAGVDQSGRPDGNGTFVGPC